MRAFVCICVIGAAMVGGAGPGQLAVGERPQIVWYRDYELALNEAKLLGRPLVVHVSSKWSPACLRLERSTFIDRTLIDLVSNSLLAVYVDADASPDLAARLHAERLPVAVILSPDGAELSRIEGYRTAEQYVAELSAWTGRARIGRDAVAPATRPKVTLSLVRITDDDGPTRERSDIRLAAHMTESPRQPAYEPAAPARPPFTPASAKTSRAIRSPEPATERAARAIQPHEPATERPNSTPTIQPREPNIQPAAPDNQPPESDTQPTVPPRQPTSPITQTTESDAQQEAPADPITPPLALDSPPAESDTQQAAPANQPAVSDTQPAASANPTSPPTAPVAPPAEPDTRPAAPVANTIVLLDGCCPVSLLEMKKLVRGDSQFQLEFDGQTICFNSAEQLEKFRSDPARYLPVLGGLCPVTFVDEGREQAAQPRFGAVFRNRIYLFAGPDERAKFQANPKRYVDCDTAIGGHCPVCATESGRLVHGDRDFQHVYQRFVYRFDSDEHRNRFAGSPQTFSADN